MLPKEHRLRKKSEFDRVFTKGDSFKDTLCLLKVVENGLDVSRFGFVVSKKVSNKAVRRNRVKRWLRGSVSSVLKDTKKEVDCVVIAFPSINTATYQETESCLQDLLKKAEII